jgi:ATP-dependent protease ClpP protease subunit
MVENNSDEEKRGEIEDMGSVVTKDPRGNIKCITIIGQIEGHQILDDRSKTTKYEHILPQLVSIEEDPEIDGLLILLNTCGGDVEAGLAIAEMISGMKKPTVSLVLGGGHSIGVPLAVASDYSFIAPSATMTVHPLRMTGMVIGVMQTFRYFERMQERIIDFVIRNSGVDSETFRRLMLTTEDIANDVGTILFADKAVECGLIDSLGGVHDALEKLYQMIHFVKK